MGGSTSNLKVVGPVQNIGGGGGLNISSYIRFQGEEEVVKNHLSVGMHTFDAAVFI